MEKVRISGVQFFVLIVFFELGTALVVAPGLSAQKDAWLAILLGLIAGLILFLVYYILFRLHPNLTLIGYLKKILGKYIGSLVGLLYLFYFLYITTRDVRDFGTLLTTSTYVYTPMLVINAMMVLAVVFVLFHGIEVLARTGEILFGFFMFMAAIATFLILISGTIDINHLRPVLENGWKPVFKAAFPLTYTFPFGEMIAFTMILPHLHHPEQGLKAGWSAMGISGILLMWTVSMDIAVLSISVASRTVFPLLASISLIELSGFFERLDVIVVLTLIIGGFFKIAILFYAAVGSAAELFSVSKHTKLIFPLGIVILISSMTVANNSVDHIKEGLKVVPFYVHLPFQTGIPLLLLGIALIRRCFKFA